MSIRRWHIALAAVLLLSASLPANAALVGTGVTVVEVPNAPSNLTAVPDSQTQVTISWTDNSGDAEDGFIVERKTGVAGVYAQIATTTTGVATYVDNGVSPDTIYFYRTAAFTGTIFSAYSNESSVTTPEESSTSSPPAYYGGGGGGGGGYIPPTTAGTNVTISGWAYPLSQVAILQNGVLALQTIAGPDGAFSGSISNFPPGTYQFYIYATDPSGRKSTPFTFPVTVGAGATTEIGNIFLAPTLQLDKQEIRPGDPLTIFGESLPNAPVQITIDSANPITVSTTSTASGAYTYDLDTRGLELGNHIAKSDTANGALISGYSIAQSFVVGTEDVSAPGPAACPPGRVDFNGDCKVNLIDFSILAYWYGKSNPPAKYRIDGTAAVDLRDFSILAYYWTG